VQRSRLAYPCTGRLGSCYEEGLLFNALPKDPNLRAQMTLKEEFAHVEAMSPVRRGRAFEAFLRHLISNSSLYPSLSFRPAGEEIDGSFWWEGRTYLIEAKWTADPIPASSIYMFKGKVDGKLVGTIGVFLSLSGYSEDAVAAVQLGKTLSVVLFDRTDIEAAVEGVPFRKILRDKLYAAGRTGEIYIPWKKLRQARHAAKEVTDRQVEASLPTVFILVEGREDANIIRELLRERFGRDLIAEPHIAFVGIGSEGWVAHSTARSMAKVLAVSTSGPGAIAIVMDANHADAARLDRLRMTYEESFRTLPAEWRAQLFLAEPTVEQWQDPSRERLITFIETALQGDVFTIGAR
jgi:hypothetical protein